LKESGEGTGSFTVKQTDKRREKQVLDQVCESELPGRGKEEKRSLEEVKPGLTETLALK